MKFLMMLTILMFTVGCPDREGDLQEVETHITKSMFRNDLNKMEIAYASNIDGAHFECQVSLTGGNNERVDNDWRACTNNPLMIPMSRGERLVLQVRAVTADNRVDLTPETFTYMYPGTTVNGTPQMIQPPVFQLGIAYEFRVPEGMHITQYASNNNYQGAGVEVVRLQQGQGYDYLGSYPLHALGGNGCSTYSQGLVSLRSGSGATYNYCHSFVNVDTFFGMFNSNYARNHIEVASDNHFNRVAGGAPHARLLLQTYGPQEEAMIRNRFNDLCHPSRVIKPVSNFHNIPMAQGFWLADELTVRDTYVCTVKLGGLSGGFYQVGGFTAITRINDVPKYGCSGGNCGGYAKYISVVYMERIAGENGVDQNFARNFQHTLLKSLQRNRP